MPTLVVTLFTTAQRFLIPLSMLVKAVITLKVLLLLPVVLSSVDLVMTLLPLQLSLVSITPKVEMTALLFL
jgi:hypothetical protein